MPPSPIPAPVPPWAKLLIQILPVVSGYLYDLLTYHGTADADALEWRRLEVKYHYFDTGAVAQDDAWVSYDIVNITGGVPDASWTSADYTTCEAAFDTYHATLVPYMTTKQVISEYRWYRRQFSGLMPPHAFAKMGPPERVTTKSIAGSSGAQSLANQSAMTITERTAWPKHWGRMYLPLYAMSLAAGGRWGSGTCTSMATALQTCYQTLTTAEFQPVVPVSQVDKQPVQGLLQVTSLQVDDVPDVVRRRRLKNTITRAVKP